MSRGLTRRQLLAGMAGSIATGTAVYAVTNTSQATTIQVDGLTVANETTSVSNPVDGLRLVVDGSVTWDSEKTPTKVVLRLEGRVSGVDSYTQLTAMDWRDSLKKSETKPFTFKDVNLLNLPNLTAEDLTPSNVGDTVTETLDLRLTLEIYVDGTELESHSVTDSATVDITREKASATASISGSGNMTVKSG